MKIPLLYCGNARVFDGMVISLLSVTKHCKKPLDVWLLTMDLQEIDPAYRPIREDHRRYLEEICRAVNPESSVTLYDATALYRETLLGAPNEQNSYTPYMFLRLYADRIAGMPSRIIYLDTDTVAARDISALYEQDLRGAEYGAVRDYYGRWFFGPNYINSGVLLLDLDQIRKTGLFRKALELCAGKKLFLPDQKALNRMARKKRILPRRFNEQHKLKKDTVIRHFSMTIHWIPFYTKNIKPWNVDAVHTELHLHAFDEILNDYLLRKPGFPD